jgi:hypothetical protein
MKIHSRFVLAKVGPDSTPTIKSDSQFSTSAVRNIAPVRFPFRSKSLLYLPHGKETESGKVLYNPVGALCGFFDKSDDFARHGRHL